MTASEVNSIGKFPGNFSIECPKSMELCHRVVEPFSSGHSVGKFPGNFPTE